MSRTAWVLAALLLCGIRTAARAENADSTRSGFGGVYSSDADPDGYVSIEALVTSGEFHVRAGGRFHSVGFIQDGEYAGVLKTRPGPRDSSHVGWLRFARAGDRVEARWSEDLGGPATHVERWTLINRRARPGA